MFRKLVPSRVAPALVQNMCDACIEELQHSCSFVFIQQSFDTPCALHSFTSRALPPYRIGVCLTCDILIIYSVTVDISG